MAEQVGDQAHESGHAQYEHECSVAMEETRDRVNITTEEVRPQPPAAGPQNCSADVISRKSPPGHIQNAGNDSVQLP